MRKNPFKNILDKKPLKDILVYGLSDILKPLYEPTGRWRKKDKPIITKWGTEFWLHGAYDLNPKTGEYDEWSGINFFNTNYSMLFEALNLLEEDGIVIEFDLWDDEKNKKLLRFFLSELNKRAETFLFDGEIKDRLISIHKGTWKRGEEHNENVKKNYKKIWPESIGISNDSNEKGMVRDMMFGIDTTVLFEGREETAQTKGCIKIEKRNENYLIYCVVDYSKYENVNYFCFYPSNENKVYVFKNDKEKVKNTKINDEPVFMINESLIHFEGEK